MIRGSIGIFKHLAKSPYFQMCVNASSEAQSAEKGYRMPEKKEIIPYRTQHPLRLHNYRVLLYANKQNLYTPALRQTVFAIPFLFMIHLIRNNPWYLTFPASLPIMIGLECYIFYKWILHKKHNKFVVERVYLYSTNLVEFVFSNKIRRKFKSIEPSHTFNDPLELVKPRQGIDGSIEWTEKGFPFPTELAYLKNQKTNEIQCHPPFVPPRYGWTKYCENFQDYVFPTDYQYANWELLINLFNGRYIDFEDSTNQVEQLPQGEDYNTLEQELQWIKQDQAKNEQQRKQRLSKEKTSAN